MSSLMIAHMKGRTCHKRICCTSQSCLEGSIGCIINHGGQRGGVGVHLPSLKAPANCFANDVIVARKRPLADFIHLFVCSVEVPQICLRVHSRGLANCNLQLAGLVCKWIKAPLNASKMTGLSQGPILPQTQMKRPPKPPDDDVAM